MSVETGGNYMTIVLWLTMIIIVIALLTAVIKYIIMVALEFERNTAGIQRKTKDLEKFVNDFNPQRRMIVTQLRHIAHGMEKIHQRSAEQSAWGSGMGLTGGLLMIGGTLATGGLAAIALGAGSVLGVGGIVTKYLSSEHEQIKQSWEEVRRMMERDQAAWQHVKFTIEHILRMIERNADLLQDSIKIAISIGEQTAFAAAKADGERVLKLVNQLWLHIEDNQESFGQILGVAAKTGACTLSAILAKTEFKGNRAPGMATQTATTGKVVRMRNPTGNFFRGAGKTGTARTAVKSANSGRCAGFAAKANIALNVIGIVIDAYDLAKSLEEMECAGDDAKKLRRIADQLEVYFKPTPL